MTKMDAVSDDMAFSAYPDMRDPRVLYSVPKRERDAMTSLWAFVERLTQLLLDAREPLLGQIKLAWWRDMAGLLATDAGALPPGEPLLAQLRDNWGQRGDLRTLTDPVEAMIFAEDDDARMAAAIAFGDCLFALCGGDFAGGGGRRWGLVWGAALQSDAAAARTMFARAAGSAEIGRKAFAGNKALFLLDRWAFSIARKGGKRNLRGEGLLLFRLGLLGR